MSYEQLPNVQYYGKPLYIKSSDKPPMEYMPGFDFKTDEYRVFQRNRPSDNSSSTSVSISEEGFQEVPKGVDGQDSDSPRSQFFKPVLRTFKTGRYTFYDENKNELGELVDIGHDPQTRNDTYFFSNGNQMKGQDDIIYYREITGGRRRKTRSRKGGKRRRTRRSRR